MRNCLLIAGGGTGGHLMPGVAVAQAVRGMRPGVGVAFVSTGKDLERRVLAREGYRLITLKARALVGAGGLDKIKALAVLPGSVGRALGIIWREKPGAVLAVGGYAAFPLGVAAWLSGVPLAVQEQNASAGLTNRALGRLARQVFISFAPAASDFPAGRAMLTGNPVRPALLESAREAADARPDPARKFRVLILGGSQGASSINRAVTRALPRLAARRERLEFIHQAGERDLAKVRAAYAEHGFAAEVEAFFEDMGRLYGGAHLVVCRAGAGTLTEVAACRRAAVAVPYPHAAGDHQTINARAQVEAGAARLVADRDLNGETLAALLHEFLDQPALIPAMEAAARDQARPDAAAQIARHCLGLMAGGPDGCGGEHGGKHV